LQGNERASIAKGEKVLRGRGMVKNGKIHPGDHRRVRKKRKR